MQSDPGGSKNLELNRVEAPEAALGRQHFSVNREASRATAKGFERCSPSADKASSSSLSILKNDPEIGRVFARYFSLAKITDQNTAQGNETLIQVPSHFHASRIESLMPQVRSALKGQNIRLEVKQTEPQEENKDNNPLFLERKLRQHAHSPSHNQANASSAARQFNISMPPQSASNGLEVQKIERSKRLSSPEVIESPYNSVVVQMLKQWAERVNKGARSQCLWLYGAGGSGKTHLARQMHEWLSLDKKLLHVDVANFFQEWRRAINNNDTFRFIQKYRKDTDVLILENLDDLQGKPGTQTEILLTVTALMEKGASIVVTSNETPVLIRELLPDALFSRLFSGYCFELPKPDRVFREKLWRKLLEQNGLSDWSLDIRVSERVLGLELATPRKVHTYFINAIGRLSLTQKLDMKDLQELEAIHGPRKTVASSGNQNTPGQLIESISKLCGVSQSALQGNSRRQNITLARRFVCLALSKFLGLTNVTIAQYLEKDPSTVSHALNTLESDLKSQRHILQQWNWICDEMGMSAST